MTWILPQSKYSEKTSISTYFNWNPLQKNQIPTLFLTYKCSVVYAFRDTQQYLHSKLKLIAIWRHHFEDKDTPFSMRNFEFCRAFSRIARRNKETVNWLFCETDLPCLFMKNVYALHVTEKRKPKPRSVFVHPTS